MAPATPPSHPPFPESLPRLPIATGFPSSLPSEPRLSPCDTWGSGPAGRWNCRGGRRRGPPWSRAAVAEVENAGFPGREIHRGRRRIWPRQPRARAPPPPWASNRRRGGELEAEDLLDGGELEAEPRRCGAPPPAPGCAGMDLRRVGQRSRPRPRPAWSSCPC
jgi:hypothetical protein